MTPKFVLHVLGFFVCNIKYIIKMKYMMKKILLSLVLMCASLALNAKTVKADIVVYGGTSAGVAAAVQAAREGKSVVLVAPENHLGAMSSAGLGFTDSGKTATIGGVSKEFYHRIWLEYKKPESWKFGKKRENFKASGQGTKAMDDERELAWIFEPSVAERVYDNWLQELKIPVYKNTYLDRSKKGVRKSKDGKIVSFKSLKGDVFAGKVFIDATFEGDLMAAAGCSYTVGRESNSVYKENYNGSRLGKFSGHRHHFQKQVDPYVEKGNPKSGLLKHVSSEPIAPLGEGDNRLQAYCFRMCLTDLPENRVPFPKPENYNADDYILALRYYEAEGRRDFLKNDRIMNGKTDTNNQGAFSTDFLGGNYDYPEADYKTREKIVKSHKDYQLGLLYFLSNDERVPEKLRKDISRWGLAKDEFTDTGNWPFYLYIREARRLIGEYVMTEHDCTGRASTPKSIGMGSYTLDSHNTVRYVTPEGFVQNEGDVGAGCKPYKISYGSIVPKKSECTNLMVTNACSASHIAYGSIRMEPVFMILGHSAATAASMAIDKNMPVQDVDYEKLSEKLKADGQILSL